MNEFLLKSEEPDNPFIADVLRLLKSQPEELKIYELVGGVDQNLMQQVIDTEDFNLGTFRKNFWLMNALYQLQSQLLEDDVYLSIGQVSVSITPGGAASYTHLSDQSEHKLRDYYLDWRNYQGTRAEDVQRLLTQFWERYYSVDKIADALSVLQLEDEQDWAVIQKRYRQLARQHHPDHGGDAALFISVREAYEVLGAHYQ